MQTPALIRLIHDGLPGSGIWRGLAKMDKFYGKPGNNGKYGKYGKYGNNGKYGKPGNNRKCGKYGNNGNNGNNGKYGQFASVSHLINGYGEWVQSLFDDGFRMYLVTFKFNHIQGSSEYSPEIRFGKKGAFTVF